MRENEKWTVWMVKGARKEKWGTKRQVGSFFFALSHTFFSQQLCVCLVWWPRPKQPATTFANPIYPLYRHCCFSLHPLRHVYFVHSQNKMATAVHTLDTGHADMLHDAQLDFYGRRLATCSSDRTIRVFDVGAQAGSCAAAGAADEPNTLTAEIAA